MAPRAREPPGDGSDSDAGTDSDCGADSADYSPDDAFSGDEEEDEGVRAAARKAIALDDQAAGVEVVDRLRKNKPLEEFNLQECKAYLRKHGLRICGDKATCIARISEHWRIKDGNAEMYYPESSFCIYCKGDVCLGDVIFFKQRIYDKRRQLIGTRRVAGKVVAESYGAKKQQHTFTIEVLWSKGPEKLLPLVPLLVKGRNIYRYMTYRQRWHDETERTLVLKEKHRRGEAARNARASAKLRLSKHTSSKHRWSVKVEPDDSSVSQVVCGKSRTYNMKSQKRGHEKALQSLQDICMSTQKGLPSQFVNYRGHANIGPLGLPLMEHSRRKTINEKPVDLFAAEDRRNISKYSSREFRSQRPYPPHLPTHNVQQFIESSGCASRHLLTQDRSYNLSAEHHGLGRHSWLVKVTGGSNFDRHVHSVQRQRFRQPPLYIGLQSNQSTFCSQDQASMQTAVGFPQNHGDPSS